MNHQGKSLAGFKFNTCFPHIATQTMNCTKTKMGADKNLACSFKRRLEQLSCPYTEGVDESWIMELIFRPGEPRIRLLQWLFSRFDSKLDDLLDPKLASTDNRMDSRVQRLLYVASSLGLCRSDDADLIRGSGVSRKQQIFMDTLLDLVCIRDKSEDTQARAMHSPGQVNRAMPVDEQYQRHIWFLDTVAAQGNMKDMFTSQVNLLPPDIAKKLEQNLEEKGYTDKTVFAVPDSRRLTEQADQLAKDVHKQEEILQALIQQYQHSEPDPQTATRVTRTLRLVMSELSQLLVGFSYCYETEMQPWCNKEPPNLSDLGPAFKRVHTLLQQFIQILYGVKSIRTSYTNLSTTTKDKVKAIIEKDQFNTDGLASVGPETLESFQECIDVLEESMARLDCSTIRSQNTTINASIVKID